MFTRQISQTIRVLVGATVTSAVLIAAPAHAADPVERTPSTMNQASVYESTLKFYLHPARLELGIEAPRELGDHPAVIVAKARRTPSDAAAKVLAHPATLTKAQQLPPVYTTQVIDLSVGE
jgi:hypothetical protein